MNDRLASPLLPLFAVLLATSLAACSAGGTGGTGGAGPGTPAGSAIATTPDARLVPVRGTVLGRPCTGGPESVDSPCPGIPIPQARVVFTPRSGPAVDAESRQDGTFTVALSPGRYTVTVVGRRFYAAASPVEVDIPAPGLATPAPITLVIDTGLR